MSFPSTLDTLSTSINWNDSGIWHAAQHNLIGAVLNALQTKVGINSSTDVTSLDYKVSQIDKAPSISEINRDIKWWVKNWNFESNNAIWYNGWRTYYNDTWGGSVSIDTTKFYKWTKSLKITTWSSWGGHVVWNSPWINWFPINSGVKYKISLWYFQTYANKAAAEATIYDANWSAISNFSLGLNSSILNSWEYFEYIVTVPSWWSYIRLWLTAASTLWNGTVWFDEVNIDEVVENQTDNLFIDTPALVWFTAKWSKSNIGLSSTGTWNLIDLWNSWAEQKLAQSFIYEKSNSTYIVIQKGWNTWTPIFDTTLSIETDNSWVPSWTVIWKKVISSAEWNAIPDWVDYFSEIPCILTPWNMYWIVLTPSSQWNSSNKRSIVASASNPYSSWSLSRYNWTSWEALSGWDMYFKILYYKPQTGFKARLHNQETCIKTDSNWILNWANIDLFNWKFRYSNVNINSNNIGVTWRLDIYQKSWVEFSDYIADDRIQLYTNSYITWKINTLLPIKHLKFNWSNVWTRNYIPYDWLKLQISIDWVNWTTIENYWAIVNAKLPITETDFVNWLSVFYVRYYNTWNYNYVCQFEVEADIDTSWIDILYNKSTNKDLYQTYVKTTSTSVNSVTYRENKYWFPVIEFSNWEYVTSYFPI